ncbi:unnamed protein product [Spirodela intermedia]|uniref:Uncharacterized protein n=1 Tax=Spirodela intermedia TaxID=51605 RepID=A0A7I8IMD9_SPIIN|nr:unnamed protein product [Spirodela intermedia]CAA6658305.1 unnamed protein product [Spirodela intermedia]
MSIFQIKSTPHNKNELKLDLMLFSILKKISKATHGCHAYLLSLLYVTFIKCLDMRRISSLEYLSVIFKNTGEVVIGKPCSGVYLGPKEWRYVCVSRGQCWCVLFFIRNILKHEMQLLLHLLNVLDMRRISSLEYLSVIFKTLGKSSLENLAMESILALKSGDTTESDISSLIFDYTSKIPDLAVEEVVSKYIGLHVKVEVTPSVRSYEKLTAYCCNFSSSHFICSVRELCSVVRRHSLKLDKDCSRSMMSLYVMIKDFEGAYNLLAELKEMNMEIDASLYNAVMIGCFKEMKHANVKPDSETFSYLIFNCGCEEDIVKCLEEMKHFQADFTKHTYIALINAYANCGKFDQAKQVKIMASAIYVCVYWGTYHRLSSKGRTSDALEMYDAMKQAGCWVEPKAIVSIIEFYRSRGQTKRLLQLLAELENSCLWFDACGRVVLYCIRNNLLSAAVDLLKQMKEKDEAGTCSVIDQIFCQIWETEPTNMEIGMGLLWAIKEDLGLLPTRASLDFLLSACVKVKDLRSARSIWVEYSKAGLPFNVLSYLRMYHALMAGGDFTAAQKISKLISHEDKHVCSIIRACKTAYTTPMDDLLLPEISAVYSLIYGPGSLWIADYENTTDGPAIIFFIEIIFIKKKIPFYFLFFFVCRITTK